jgi:RNA methyltransferase, TrmH family
MSPVPTGHGGPASAAAELTSTANPRVKALVRLRTRRSRDELGQTLIEGHDELRLALAAGVRPTELYFAPSLVRPDQRDLLDDARAAGAAVIPVSGAVFDKISYRESPDGWLAVSVTPGTTLAGLTVGANPLLLVCEGIEKPGNLGAMLRTAEGFAVDAVISASPVTDFGNPNAVRASKGTVFAVPVAAGPSGQVLEWLRDRGIKIAVTTPQGTTPLPAAELTGPTAVVVGAESTGVTDLWLEQADETLVIPMLGHVNSLNASTAAALALYEARRQRASRPQA